MGNWADNIIRAMDDNLGEAKERDTRFFRIDELKRNIRRLDDFGSHCRVCILFRPDVERVARHIGVAVHVPGTERHDLDRLTAGLSRHMRKQHRFFPPCYFSYLHSLAGVIAGFLAGFLLMEIFPATKWLFPWAGFVAGLISGLITGSAKDRKVMEEKRLM